MSGKQHRWQVIRSLLSRNQISTQEQLQALLEVEAIRTSQATLSRDLRDMGVFKGDDGLQLPRADFQPAIPPALADALQRNMLSAECAANLVIVRTAPGEARALAGSFDAAGLHLVLGAVAGENTLFIATRSASQAARLQRLIKRAARRR